jgi:hypothetical protein
MARTSFTWAISRDNRKTGPIPTGWVGDSFDAATESCKGCKLHPSREGGCYAWSGNVRRGFGSILRAASKRPERYALAWVLAMAPRFARYARLGALGDPSGVRKREYLQVVETIRSEGLGVLSYTHMWRRKAGDYLRLSSRASCDSLAEADEAADRGWSVAAILPWNYPAAKFRTPAGREGIVCPAQLRDVTCNQCGLCDVQGRGSEVVVGFLDHSPSANAKRRARELPVAQGVH